MGFKEGDAEKMMLASFRHFPLRRMPKMSDLKGGKEEGNQHQQPKGNQHGKESKVVEKAAKSQKDTSSTNNAALSTKVHVTNEKNKRKDIKEESRKKKEEQTTVRYSKEGKQIPIGNGGKNFDFNFQWTQTIQEVSIALPLPPNTRAKELNVQIKHDRVSVKSLKQMQSTSDVSSSDSDSFLLKGQLKHIIRTDESTWTIEDNVLLLVLDKKDKTWWDCVLTTSTGTETENNTSVKNLIDTALIDSTSKISEYDQATQGMIRKIIFDQRQERLGLPKSDDILRKEAVARMKDDIDDDDIIPPPPPKTSGIDSSGNSSISMISSDNMPPLPSGVEYIDKNNFPPHSKQT